MPRKQRRTHRPPRRTRSVLPRIMIVCEGESERAYFNDMCRAYRTTSVNTKQSKRSDPRKVVQTALDYLDEGYDAIYVVLDDDTPYAGEALDTARSHGINLADSEPCFEYWLLLHFEETGMRFGQSGTDSACREVERRLQRRLPAYSKGDSRTYRELENRMDEAIERAYRRAPHAYSYTNVHVLVEKLRTLRD